MWPDQWKVEGTPGMYAGAGAFQRFDSDIATNPNAYQQSLAQNALGGFGGMLSSALSQVGAGQQAALSNTENNRRFDLMQGKDSARWKFLNGYDPQGRANQQQFGYTSRMGGDPTLNPYEYTNENFLEGLAAYNQQYGNRSPLIADRLRQIGPLLGAFLPGGGAGGGFNTDFGMSVRPAVAPYPYTNPVA